MAAIYLVYLRKSRQDNPDESVEEVLAKHETMLQEYAKKELGYTIPRECIYREIVSGESIEDRIEIKKVLLRMENPDVKGILVVDPQRLSRGDLEDCGRLINALKWTNTLVLTPPMTYDMNNKMERRFFQDELLRGRDYLEYTKEILWRGRIASAKRGCYVSSVPPYGYDRVKIGKDYTLAPNQNADIVRFVFDLYVNKGIAASQIARMLNEKGIKNFRSGEWGRSSISYMLSNQHYIGKIVYNRRHHIVMMEEGQRTQKRTQSHKSDIIVVDGKHPAIIDMDTWNKAQHLMESKKTPKLKHGKTLRNPLAGILVCGTCGHMMTLNIQKSKASRLVCTRISSVSHGKSVRLHDVMNALIVALETAELPQLQTSLKTRTEFSSEIQTQMIRRIEKQLSEYKEQEETQYELLETKKYTQELFDRRNAVLREKIELCEMQLKEAKSDMQALNDDWNAMIQLQDALDSLKDDSLDAQTKNFILKAIVEKIIYRPSPIQKTHGSTDFTLDILLRI